MRKEAMRMSNSKSVIIKRLQLALPQTLNPLTASDTVSREVIEMDMIFLLKTAF
jgi:hypothetical protein